jgi:hypothetical protein
MPLQLRVMADGEIIYLDDNATTPLDPAVIEEMLRRSGALTPFGYVLNEVTRE